MTGDPALGRGDDDFWHVWQRMRGETCQHIVAADARHAKVENDDAVFVGGEEVESFLPVTCGVHGVETRATEERGSQVPERVVVINRKRGIRDHRDPAKSQNVPANAFAGGSRAASVGGGSQVRGAAT